MSEGKYRAHNARREDRADGSVLLTSEWPLGEVARCATDWLEAWAGAAPDRVFIAERSGAGWREVTYAQALEVVRAIASNLADRGMSAKTPILIISGNSVDHALLTLAAHYIGVPTVPVAEQYALIPAAHPVLERAAAMIKPGMVYADDAARYSPALDLSVIDGVEKLVSVNVPDEATAFESMTQSKGNVSSLNAAVGPDTIAK